jgi:hypothetical protein
MHCPSSFFQYRPLVSPSSFIAYSMASYFDEHSSQSDNDHLAIARLLFESGFNEALGLSWEHIFHGEAKPACKKMIAELERCKAGDVTVKGVDAQSSLTHAFPNSGQCPICIAWWEEADASTELLRLPCRHLFHSACISPWLQRTNTCPVCRHEMPSENAAYEQFKLQQVDEHLDDESNGVAETEGEAQGGSRGTARFHVFVITYSIFA